MPFPGSTTRRGLIALALGAVSGVVYGATREGGAPVASRTGPSPDPPAGTTRVGSATTATGVTTDPGAGATTTDTPGRPLELPRGGRVLLPEHRLVGFCGLPGSPALGRLGVGDLDARVRELERLGAAYTAGRTLLPVLELVAVVAQPRPGPDGRYRVRVGEDVVRTYLDAARRHRALLLLNVQPGRARFVDEVAALEPWLREPDVGLALDPEWAVRRGQVPGRVYGRSTGAELDAVAARLAGIVAAGRLPEKALVVHQLAPQIITGWSALRRHPGVVLVKSVDGIGPPEAKRATWRRLVTTLPVGMRPGFKLFFEEDTEGPSTLMTPTEVLALRPQPEYVMYE